MNVDFPVILVFPYSDVKLCLIYNVMSFSLCIEKVTNKCHK